MPTVVPNNSVEFKPVPAGSHAARCYQFVHIGTVTEVIQGKEVVLNKARFTFELPDELRDDGKPNVISEEFTLTMSKKGNLRKFLDGMLGHALTEEEAKSFDVESLIGKTCLLNVIHKISPSKGTTYAKINNASPLPKGMKCGEAVNPVLIINYTDAFDEMIIDTLPDFIKNKIKSSVEYKARVEEL